MIKNEKESHPYAEICKEANYQEIRKDIKAIVEPHWKRYKSFHGLVNDLTDYVTKTKDNSFLDGMNYIDGLDYLPEEEYPEKLFKAREKGKKKTVKCGCCHCKAERKQKKENEEAYKRDTELINMKLKMFKKIMGIPTV